MKTKIFKAILLITVLAINILPVFSQGCGKTAFCSKEDYADYDYRSQSSYAILAPGDTARASIVVYAKQDTRILVCFDPKLGAVAYRVLETIRESKRTIKDIKKTESETPVYKLDADGNPVQKKNENGEPMFDENYNPIYELDRMNKEVKIDTIWQVEKTQREKVLYDNKSNGKKYWEDLNVAKTRRVIIEVVIPRAAKRVEGCVNIEVGHRAIGGRKSFTRTK